MTRTIAVLFACVSALLAGPVLQRASHAYESVPLALTAQGSGPVGVAVLDERLDINPSGKTPDFVGVQYPLEGVLYDVKTGTGRPMADTWADAIVTALNLRGFEARPVATSNTMDRAAAVRSLSAAAPRGVLVGVKDWRVDARRAADLVFQISAQVIDGSGKVLGEAGVGGRQCLGADYINGATSARDRSMAAFKAKLEQPLNDPAVTGTLK